MFSIIGCVENKPTCVLFGRSFDMESKEYLAAKHEFWNCIRMAPFSLFFSLIFAFKEWYPEMKRLKSHA